MNLKKLSKKELTQALVDGLKLEGYKGVNLGAGVIVLRKIEKNRIEKSIFFNYNIYPDEFSLYKSISCNVSFPDVERLLRKYYKKYSLKYLLNTIFNTYSFESSLKDHFSISSISDIEKAISFYKKRIEEGILPFFEKFTTLKDVYEEVESYNNDFDKINKFLYHPQPIRRMIIYCLQNQNNWVGYAERIVSSVVAKGKKQPSSDFGKFAKYLPELFEELKSMQVVDKVADSITNIKIENVAKEMLKIGYFKNNMNYIVDDSHIIVSNENENGVIKSIVYTYFEMEGAIFIEDNVKCSIYFPDIEEYLKKYYEKYKLDDELITTFESIEFNGLSKIALRSNSDIQKIVNRMQGEFSEGINTFFDNNDTIKKLYKRALDAKTIESFICKPSDIRYFIMKRLINTPDWEDHAKDTIDFYKDTHDINWEYIQFLPELIDELKNK